MRVCRFGRVLTLLGNPNWANAGTGRRPWQLNEKHPLLACNGPVQWLANPRDRDYTST